MKLTVPGLAAASSLVMLGCETGGPVREAPTAVIEAFYASQPVQIDGRLDDDAWKRASTYRTSLGQDRIAEGETLREGGQVQVAWDDQYLYIGIRFEDSDLCAEGEEDGLHHYTLGDLVEVFLKPENSPNETWYWELYGTPAGKRTVFWFPGRGRILPSSFAKYTAGSGLRVAAQCQGTLNRWEDRDIGWTAELAVPVKELTARGEAFGPGSRWRILVARYNYSRYLPRPELSMMPALSKTNYHLYEEYGLLKLVKPAAAMGQTSAREPGVQPASASQPSR